MTEDHRKLLFLIYKYSRPAPGRAGREVWVNKTALLVLIYEAVVLGVFDYDFAPASIVMGSRRIFINISQVRGGVGGCACRVSAPTSTHHPHHQLPTPHAPHSTPHAGGSGRH